MAWFRIPGALNKSAAPGWSSFRDPSSSSSSDSIISHTATEGVSGDCGLVSSPAGAGLRRRPFWLGRLPPGVLCHHGL